MAKFRIMSKDGNTVKYEGKLRYIGTYLKPSYVEFPEVSSPFPIEWEMGDYVYYPRTDMYYRLFSIPQVTKQAKKNTDIIKGYESDGTPIYVNAYGDAFTYSNVQLHAATKELEIAPFRDLVAADNGIHFSTSPDVVTTENAYGIASRIQACMDDLYPGKWEIHVASLGADHEVDLTETRDFALSGGTCLDALSKIYELWQDIGWIHTYENGKDVITIGYANVRKESNTTTPYLYGKGNGLTAIKKNQTNKDEFATRLYVYGSDRNLPPRFYNQLSIANAESVDIRNLMIPVDKWGRTDGLPDARKAYIENTSAVEKYGVIPKTHYFDSLESGADIYPSIEGMTASQVRSALSAMGESDYYPSNVYFGSERMDEVLFGDDVKDTGTANEEGKSYTKIIRVPFEDIYVDGVIPAESTTAVIGKHLLLNRTFEGPGKAKIEVKSEASGYVLDAGYKSVTLIVELSDSITKDKTVSQRVELPLSKSENGDWNFTIPRSVIAKYDDEEYKSFPVYFEVSVSVEMESETTEEISTEFVINSGRCDIEYTDILPKFFTMTLKQIGFNISDRAANGNGKVISMKTGACAGRSFVIEACEKDSKNDGWKLTCRRQQDNTLGMWFPNINYKVSSGDRFVLLDIAMPDSYIYAAMQRLFDEGQKLIARASKVQSHYEPSIDAKLMAESGRILREGMYMEITDEDMVDGKTDYILIDTLNIYEDESSIPTYKVSLRERRKVTYKGTPSASSSINGSSVSDDADEKKVNLDGYATEKYVDEKYGALLDWFYQYDENTIGTRFNFVSEKQIASGGIGKESGGGGGGDFILDYDSVVNALGYVPLGPDSLDGYVQENDLPDFSKYLTSSDLETYDSAIKQWVNDQGFITSAGGGDIDLSDYAKKADLEALTTRFDAVFDGREDQDVYINKWHELVAFLDGIEEGDSLANTLVNQDDRLLALEDMFAWEYDSEGNRTAIRAKSHFFSTGQVAAGGIGEESGGGGGGGISLLFDSTKTWADYTSDMADYALAAYHGKALNDRLVKVEGKATDVSFTQTLLTGKPIGTIMVDGVSQTMYAPASYSADDIVPTQERNFVSLQDVEYWNTAYLPLTGGTLSGTWEHILEIKRTNGTSAYIKFTTVRGNNGYLGFGSDGKPTYLTYDGTANELYHKGNLDISNYLPLSGGTLSARLMIAAGSDKKIVLNNTDNDNKYQFISFQQNGTEYGQLGTAGSDDLMWGKEGNEKIILHSGNIGSYAFVPRTRIKSDADANTLLTNGVYLNETGNGSGNNNFPQAYSILLTAALSSSFAAQISIGNKSMWIRRKVDSWSDWVEVINSTNIGSYNAGSATKLETARTIWGQTFDGTGNVSGSIYGGSKVFSIYGYDDSGNTNIVDCSGVNKKLWVGYGSAPKSYDTELAGYNINFHYGTGRTTGLILNSSGNVTIGSSGLAGTDYKLYVNGKIFATEQIHACVGFILRTTDGTGIRASLSYASNTLYIQSGYNDGSDTAGSMMLSGKNTKDLALLDVRATKSVFNGNVTIGSTTSGTLKIGGATLTWDAANNALKIEGNVYATGQMASGGIGEEGDNIATYDKWGGLKPAYSTTGKATLTTASASFTNNPTIAARTTTAGRYYAVEMDAVGRAFVNVPWTDTNYWTLDASVSRIYPKDAARQLCIGGTGNSAYSTSLYKLVVHGSAFAISGSWQSSSDMTMKDIVKDITLDIKDIAAAPSFVFKWKGSEDNTEWLGTSAQYWKAILPTAVKGEDGSYSLCYGELALTTAIAIAKKTMNHEERIKELELQITTLKRKLSVYEN